MKMCNDYIRMSQLSDPSFQSPLGYQQTTTRNNEQAIYGKDTGIIGMPSPAMFMIPIDPRCIFLELK
jgi:hypothetical protein